ncbi:MAG TPA: glycosyltransferase family 4 protein [Tepidisphaeraceae bacterium]
MNCCIVAHDVARNEGQGRINYELVRHLLACGDRVEIVGDKVAPDLVGDGAARFIRVPVRCRKPNLLKVRAFATGANACVRARRARFDVVIGNGYVLTEPHDVNLCQFVHGCWIQSPVHVSRVRTGPYAWYQYQYSYWNARWEKKAYAAARVTVAPSNKIRQELLTIGLPPDRVQVIFNGVDLDEFRPGEANRADWQLPAGVPLGLFVGDIRTPRKNLDTTLKALAQAPGVHLAVVGALERSPFPEMATRLGIADRVHFLGFRRDVARVMRACDFFAFPSRYEAGSLVLLEAMASGLPVLTATSAGGSELAEGDCGLVMDDPDDLASLAQGMRELAADESLRKRQGATARRVAEQHAWRRMAEEYRELAQGLAARHARPIAV